MFRLIFSFLKTILSIIIFLLLAGSLIKYFRGEKEESEPRFTIESSGKCLPPGIKGKGDWFEKNNERSCHIYVFQGNYIKGKLGGYIDNSPSYNCLLTPYTIPGVITKKKYVVDRKWLIFPKWQEENVCMVILSEYEWSKIKNTQPSDYQPTVLLEENVHEFSSRNFNGLRKLHFGIAYPGTDISIANLTDYLEKAKEDIFLKENVFSIGNQNDVIIEVYGKKNLIGEIGISPLCKLSSHSTAKNSEKRIFSIECKENDVEIWKKKDKIIENLPPESRRHTYRIIGLNLVSRSLSSMKGSHHHNSKIIQAYASLGISYKNEIPTIEKVSGNSTLSETQLRYILNEGSVLGWWLEDRELSLKK